MRREWKSKEVREGGSWGHELTVKDSPHAAGVLNVRVIEREFGLRGEHRQVSRMCGITASRRQRRGRETSRYAPEGILFQSISLPIVRKAPLLSMSHLAAILLDNSVNLAGWVHVSRWFSERLRPLLSTPIRISWGRRAVHEDV